MPLAEKLLAIAIRAQNFTGASGVAVAINEGDEVVCRASWGTSAPDVGVRLRDQNSFTYQCMRAGVAMRCDDASSDPRVDPVACANLGIASIAIAPVGHGDNVLGVIAAFSESPNTFTETHMVVLTTLGEVVAKFLRDEPSVTTGVSADEPIPVEVEPAPPADEDLLHDVKFETPVAVETEAPAPFETAAQPPEPAPAPLKAPELHPEPAAPPAAAAEVHPEPPGPAHSVPVLSSLLASARSRLPKGAIEKDMEVKPEQIQDVPAAPGLVSAAEQIAAPEKPKPSIRPKSAGEKPSAAARPFIASLPLPDKPRQIAGPSFSVAPGFDWNDVLHRKFLIPVGAAAVLVFALVTWTFHSFRSRHAPAPPPVTVEQPADTSPAPAPEPAELTSATPANTVMDVSVKAATIEKPPTPARKQTAENLGEKSKAPAPILETTVEVRKPNAIPVAPAKPEAAPPPSLALVDVPPQLPAFKSAVPASSVVGPSVSHLVPSRLLHSPAPVYPDTAKRIRMTGTVVLSARIGADGKVKSLTVVKGPEVFRASAAAAVKNWRYRPATLDGQPVESTAEITLNFALPQ